METSPQSVLTKHVAVDLEAPEVAVVGCQRKGI